MSKRVKQDHLMETLDSHQSIVFVNSALAERKIYTVEEGNGANL